jgi:glycosyltransferase involved in cell wall biosynthesis
VRSGVTRKGLARRLPSAETLSYVCPLLRERSMALNILTVLAGAGVGGAETFFVSLTTALKRSGLEVHAVLKPNARREAALAQGGVAFETAPFGGLFDFVTGKTLRHAADVIRPNIVLAFAGRAASFARRGDYVVMGRLGGYYNLKNFRHCDHLICNAPDVVRYVTEGGWPKDRAHLIPNFPSVPDAPKLDRAAFGTPEDAPLAVALGRLHPSKGIDVLLRAAALMPSLWIWIAGEGPERAKLEKLAQQLGVASRVKFLGWRDDRAGLYKAADVVVYPSREEPFGNVVVEAWACGAPIVTTTSTGPQWLARDGEDAILVPIDDPRALARGIAKLLSSKDLVQRLVEAGNKRIKEDFSEAAILRRYIELFESVKR